MARREFGNPPVLDSVAEATNPAGAQVMADTGALDAGVYEARIIVGGSVAGQYRVERRNAANGANVGDTVVLYGAAAQSGQYALTYILEASERIRIVMDDALTGVAACAIQVERLA